MTPLCWSLLILSIVFGAPLLCWAAANVSGQWSEQERDGE